jgi:hypothetical protein
MHLSGPSSFETPRFKSFFSKEKVTSLGEKARALKTEIKSKWSSEKPNKPRNPPKEARKNNLTNFV